MGRDAQLSLAEPSGQAVFVQVDLEANDIVESNRTSEEQRNRGPQPTSTAQLLAGFCHRLMHIYLASISTCQMNSNDSTRSVASLCCEAHLAKGSMKEDI